MTNRINNSYNMKLIRKAMIDFDLDNLEQLGDFLYISASALRDKINGKRTVRKSDIEFMEQKLNIHFNWDEIRHVKGNFYLFYDKEANDDDNLEKC